MSFSEIRKILHLDLDAFFCAVEELKNPALVGKPFAVGGRPQERGVVASCSYAARKFGVRSAMPMARALRLCPDLLIIPSFHAEYSQYSRKMLNIVSEISPVFEQVSIDEVFVDVTSIPAPALQTAQSLQQRINQELRLPCSIGVAENKLVAKIANDVGKAAAHGDHPPNAITVVAPGQTAAFLAPLPVDRLWGVGPKTAERLRDLNLNTIEELANASTEELVRLFGKNGQSLALHARGIDDSPVSTTREMKSISQEVTFSRDVKDFQRIASTLRYQSKQVGERLKEQGLFGKTVKIKVRWPNFATLTRQTTLAIPTDQDEEIYQSALRLFSKVWQEGKPVRLIGVGVSDLQASIRQMSLWEIQGQKSDPRKGHLDAALDELRSRFGETAIRFAAERDKNNPD